MLYLFELFFALSVFSQPLKKRIPDWLWYVVAIGGTLLLAVLGCFFDSGSHGQNDPGSMTVEYMLSLIPVYGSLFAVSFVYLWGTCRINLRETFYCFSCAYLMEHAAYCVRLLLGLVLPQTLIGAGTPLYFVVTAAVYAAFYFLFARRMVEDGHYGTTAQLSLDITVTTLGITLLLSILATRYAFEQIHAAYALIACLLMMTEQVRTQRQLRTQADLAVQRELWRKNKAQYEAAKDTIEIINRKSHDLKHQIGYIRSMSDDAQRDRVLADMEESVFVYDAMRKTGNEILDTVLTEKGLLCNDDRIELNCIADGRLVAHLDAIDMYTLLGNALDNAIEAQRKLPEKERRIELRVVERAGLVLIQVQNPYTGALTIKDGVPETSKPNKLDHGYGVKSVMDIAARYGGFATVTAKDGLFTLRVALPKAPNTAKNEQAAAGSV